MSSGTPGIPTKPAPRAAKVGIWVATPFEPATTPLEGDLGMTGPSSRASAVVAWYAPNDLRAMATDTGTDPMAPDMGRAARDRGASAAADDRRSQPLADPSELTTALGPFGRGKVT